MAKLHELLAVSSNVTTQSKRIMSDLGELFTKKRHHFQQRLVTFRPKGENDVETVEEQTEIQTSVQKELAWAIPLLCGGIDVPHQIVVGNMSAKATVEIPGKLVLEDVPAQTLLELEKRLNELRDLVNAVPTLDPAKGFQPDASMGDGYNRAREASKGRTRKETDVIVKYPATTEHPAQTELVVLDKEVGKVVTLEWSTEYTPQQKAEILTRLDLLVNEVKAARARANEQSVDVKGNRIGETILNYVFFGK